MKISLNFGRRSLLLSAALLVLAALVVILGVIPPVKTDTFPLATPERAVGAFMVSAVLYLLFAAALVIIGVRAAGRTRRHLGSGRWLCSPSPLPSLSTMRLLRFGGTVRPCTSPSSFSTAAQVDCS